MEKDPCIPMFRASGLWREVKLQTMRETNHLHSANVSSKVVNFLKQKHSNSDTTHDYRTVHRSSSTLFQFLQLISNYFSLLSMEVLPIMIIPSTFTDELRHVHNRSHSKKNCNRYQKVFLFNYRPDISLEFLSQKSIAQLTLIHLAPWNKRVKENFALNMLLAQELINECWTGSFD